MGTTASDKINARCFSLKFSKNTDSDVIRKLESVDSVNAYIRELVRNDLKEEQNMENYVTVDSFGSDLPENWEEIASFLNPLYAEIAETESDPRERREKFDALWESYWRGEIPGAPKAV